MPITPTYNPVLHAPATAKTQLTPTRRYPRYAETEASSVPVGGSAALCFRYSSFYIHHSSLSFTFSAKERDPETGLSYFGSRYYSSDLSIWLSVDPMSDKYASLSPYTYCANNPVKLVDPNGKDPIYAKNFWGKVKKIGDDGQCGSGSYLVRGKTARAVKAATKAGEFYTGDLSASDEVIHIPTGQILQNVQFTVEQSFYNETKTVIRISYEEFKLMGRQEDLK